MPIATPNDPGVFRRILTRNVTLPLAVGLLSALLFIALIAYLMQSQGWVERSDRVISRAYASEKADLELETSLRGYLLAGEDRFLDRFERTLVAVRSEVERAEGAGAGRAGAGPAAATASRPCRRRGTTTRASASRNARRPPTTGSAPGTGEGKRLKDAVRDEYDAFIARPSSACARSAPKRPTAMPGSR